MACSFQSDTQNIHLETKIKLKRLRPFAVPYKRNLGNKWIKSNYLLFVGTLREKSYRFIDYFLKISNSQCVENSGLLESDVSISLSNSYHELSSPSLTHRNLLDSS